MRQMLVYEGSPNETYTVNASDTKAGLGAAKIYQSGVLGGLKAVGCIITVETFGIRYCVGGEDPTTSLGHLLNPGDVLILRNWKAINTFLYINESAGDNATLMVTVEF